MSIQLNICRKEYIMDEKKRLTHRTWAHIMEINKQNTDEDPMK